MVVTFFDRVSCFYSISFLRFIAKLYCHASAKKRVSAIENFFDEVYLSSSTQLLNDIVVSTVPMPSRMSLRLF